MTPVAAALHERLHNGLRCPEAGLPDAKVVLWCSLAERAVQLDELARLMLAREVAALVRDIDWGRDGFTEGIREAVGVLLPDADAALWSTIFDE